MEPFEAGVAFRPSEIMRCFRLRVTLQVHGGVHDLGKGALRARWHPWLEQDSVCLHYRAIKTFVRVAMMLMTAAATLRRLPAHICSSPLSRQRWRWAGTVCSPPSPWGPGAARVPDPLLPQGAADPLPRLQERKRGRLLLVLFYEQ